MYRYTYLKIINETLNYDCFQNLREYINFFTTPKKLLPGMVPKA